MTLRRVRRILLLLTSLACTLLCAPSVLADVSTKDMGVAARALSFLASPPSGTVTMGIVYSAGKPQSAQEAQSLYRTLGAGLTVGNITLKPLLVDVTNLRKTEAGLYFLATGTGTDAEALAQVTRAKHLICLTTDLTQVQAGRCAVGIRSDPKIQIFVNRQTAAQTGASFSTVFRVMTTEM